MNQGSEDAAAQERQADRLAVVAPHTVTGSAVLDAAIALVTGLLAHRAPNADPQEQAAIENALNQIFADIQAARPLDVASVYAELVISLLGTLELIMGTTSQELWRHRVAAAVRHNEGGHHG